jgi:hypothetical protein
MNLISLIRRHNDLKHLQNEHEQMIQDYNKMEQSNMQGKNILGWYH